MSSSTTTRTGESRSSTGESSKELLREAAYPVYLPQQGTGANIVAGEHDDSRVIGSDGETHTMPPTPEPGYGTAGASATDTAAAVTAAISQTQQHGQQRPARPQNAGSSYFTSATGNESARPAGTPATPSSVFTPNSSVPQFTESTNANLSPDWLPSPVAEEADDERDISRSPSVTPASTGVHTPAHEYPTIDGVSQTNLATSMQHMDLDDVVIVPSTRGQAGAHASDTTSAAAATAASVVAAVAMPAAASSASASTLPSARLEPPLAGQSGRGTSVSPARQKSSTGTPAHSSGQSTPARPVAPEHKKSMFGKLFHHGKEKEQKDRDHHQTSPGEVAANDSRSRSTSNAGRNRGYSSTSNSTPYASGAESDSSHPATSVSTSTTNNRARSTSITNRENKEEKAHGFSSFLGRRTSNKKLEKPDPTLVAMARDASRSTSTVVDSNVPSPNGSQTTLHHHNGSSTGLMPPSLAAAGVSSTAASRGSTPDMSSLGPISRPGTADPTRHASDSSATGVRPSARSGSQSTSILDSFKDKHGSTAQHGGSGSGTHTPAEGGAPPHREKSFKEQLAALGSVSKLGRKPSQTSRRSDDGRSEKSDHPTPGGVPQHPGIKRAPSVGGQSNASTSLLQKYGVCEKTAIGKGATAVVKLAHKWDRSTEKLYAVKEFRKRRKNETEKEYVKKLTSEFCISSTLHHINVVETVDLVQNEEKHWCEVMEYCPGGDLYAAIKKGDMDNDTMNLYFKQIITGVAYLHSMGVAHRDIKPENLLLDNQGHVKITDFGVSDVFRMCWEKQTHMSKGLCGSEPYIAPEQFEQKEYDARLVDVWAVAVVFYCMQAQELPWRVAKASDPSFHDYLQAYPASSSPPPLGNLHPRECRAIIRKMLDPSPKTRLNMDAVLEDPFLKAIKYTAEPTNSTPLKQ